MPPRLVDLLADLSAVEAVALSAALFVVTAFPLMRLARADLRAFVEGGGLDRLLLVVGPAVHAVAELARDVAALLILLSTSPKGAMA